MIYVTGDTHRNDISRFKNFKGVTKDDKVIILGDHGFIWNNEVEKNNEVCAVIEQFPFTTIVLDGNHENHEVLKDYDIVDGFRGKVSKLSKEIVWLRRGEVYLIEGQRIFVMGGAYSIDKEYRTYMESWWPEELPNSSEYANALKNLDNCNWEVDYVLTHTASHYSAQTLGYEGLDQGLNKFFDTLEENLKFKHWYFGHFHHNRTIDSKHTCLYQAILPLGETLTK